MMHAPSVPIPPQALTSVGTTAARDLLEGLLQWNLWMRLGWLEIKRRYRRTVVGPFWSAISLGVFVLLLGSVGSGLWNQQSRDYLPFLASGMVVWIMISTIVTESCSLFVSSSNLFRQVRFNYSVMVYALVYRNFAVFLHNLIVYLVIVLVLASDKITPIILLTIPGILLVLINGGWVALLLGMFCLRFRDLQQFVTTLMQIAMFVTPIFWLPGSLQTGNRVVFIDLNPLYHFIEIVRAPALGAWPSIESYVAVVAITVVGWGGTFALFRYFRKRIAYWS
jgi:ABC-type polysaccharide/polyol phosphate export permease